MQVLEKREVSVPEEWCKCGRTGLVRMKITIHDATAVNKGRKDRNINMEIKKLMLLSSTINS